MPQLMLQEQESMAKIPVKSKSSIGNFEQIVEESQSTYGKVSHAQVICQTALTKVDHLIYMQRSYHAA